MGKRRASRSDSDDEENEETPSKRARVDVAEQGEDREEGETAFEARYIDRVRASIESHAKGKGGVAMCGIIQYLEMHQFMCHPRLSFTFGPQINFIIGHNGSGKSAVLSAITIALGGKAITTGRGNGLKSFIREGQNQAEVTIVLKNEGEEAFKPEIYGKSITITRRFSKEGTSSYKIKNKDGKVISNSKKDLSAICDHMNIQVDNPLNILSQDSARQFLSSSHPRDKYQFFLKGTQLQQLYDEYETCRQNIQEQYKVIGQKSKDLPDLKMAVKQAAERYKSAQKAIETKSKIEDLKKEMAWSHVKTKEDEMKAKIEEVAKASRRIPKMQSRSDEAKATFDGASQQVAALEDELRELGDVDQLIIRRDNVQDEITRNKNLLKDLRASMKGMDEDIKRNTGVIEQFDAQIKEEEKKLQDDKQAEREERHRKIEEMKSTILEQETQLREVNENIRISEQHIDDLMKRKTDAERDKASYDVEVEQCFEQLEKIESQARNSLNAFGRGVPNVLNRIKESNWYGQVPIGPLGAFVTLRDQTWAQVMRIQLGHLVRSFAITDPRDKTQLKRILTESGNHQMQIIVSEVDLFDYSGGEPPSDVLTVLRALDFGNEYVKRILINQSHIERILLAPVRREGEEIASSVHGGGTAWTADLYRIVVYGDGGYNSGPMTNMTRGDNRMQLFTDRNLANEKQRWKESGREADARLQAAKDTIQKTLAELASSRRANDMLHRDAKAITDNLRSLKRERDILTEQHNESVPVNIGALIEARKDHETDKEKICAQFEHAMATKTELDEKQRPLIETLRGIKEQIANFQGQKNEITNNIEQAISERVGAQHNLEHWQDKLKEEAEKLAVLEEAALRLQEEYEDWTKKAEDYCDGTRVENPRKSDELDRLVKSSESALRNQERAQGATIEQLETRLLDAERRYATAQKDVKELTLLYKILKSATNARLTRWEDFRQHIALRTKLLFQHLLSNRAYYGKVLFDHESGRLDLKVQTDDLAATQGLNKDAKSLSGGEKSFSTICLLLALWQAIGCPIRCLDEFDVFMDAVNRRISMRMIIDTANSSDGKQYVLITPQDMSAVQLGPTVRVHRMGDPERGQNTLQFS